ncbi:hypothetical protein [Azospirillum sp.]|uniref:hypothetical protein n=1 Tax=Azospirillum sp. TaxID=34012 RepID=UPI003D7107C6
MKSARITAALCNARAAVAHLEAGANLSENPTVAAHMRAAAAHIAGMTRSLAEERTFEMIGVMPVECSSPVALVS